MSNPGQNYSTSHFPLCSDLPLNMYCLVKYILYKQIRYDILVSLAYLLIFSEGLRYINVFEAQYVEEEWWRHIYIYIYQNLHFITNSYWNFWWRGKNLHKNRYWWCREKNQRQILFPPFFPCSREQTNIYNVVS
jgi:hypothetical protein